MPNVSETKTAFCGNSLQRWNHRVLLTLLFTALWIVLMMTRQFFAGGITGSAGTDSVDVFGYINFLKDCDASVQWTLFMPDFAKQQQNVFAWTALSTISGTPFISRFAFAKFSGDMEKMHRHDGYDSDAMYDVTRNIILGQNVTIPYPDKYWTAEVFLEGFQNGSTAFLFSVKK